MIRLIINIVTLIVLAVFIAMNVSYETSINLFGFKYDNISTVAVIIISLVSGVLYSFLYYLLTYISKSKKLKIRNKSKQAKLKEKELKTKEKNIHKTIEEGVKESTPHIAEPVELELSNAEKKKKSPLKLFKSKKNN
ncbi:MAG: lipopolysaccharide assembly protein LapA domain-containing protein [Spirochaetia bacterium]|jgi:uncharacterized integral membrane protein|nr:lipopolysaccharide assembly protein LapA domain-containing protein [Spirochaetia bacterium]